MFLDRTTINIDRWQKIRPSSCFLLRVERITEEERVSGRKQKEIEDMAMSLLLPLSTASVSSRVPSASLSFNTGARIRTSSSVNVTNGSTVRSGLLHCSFISSSPTLSVHHSSFAGLSLGVNLQFNKGTRREKVHRFVVRAGKAALCLTKRNRSRKSLARTHGFRRRMRTTSGRAVIKRRRAKGRKILCTKTNPSIGK